MPPIRIESVSRWLLAAVATLFLSSGSADASGEISAPLSPTALAASHDGRTLFVACGTASAILVFDMAERKETGRIATAQAPSGLALSADDQRLYVTCAGPRSVVEVVDVGQKKTVRSLPAGHTALSPVLSPDGRTLYVCNRFDNEVAFLDIESGTTTRRVRVPREPFAAAVTSDGRRLLVANHLHNGRADLDLVAASLSVIDVAGGRVEKEIILPNGSGLLRAVALSPDGKYAAVSHQISRFHLPTTQIERGWINTNALSLIDLAKCELLNTVLLDNIDSGAANPWAAAWSADGRRIVVTHAGTHELSVIDAPGLLQKLAKLAAASASDARPAYGASRTPEDVPNDLAFLVGLRERISLAEIGPRSLVLSGSRAWFAGYFSDTLGSVDLAAAPLKAESMPLGPPVQPTLARQGELHFNDARLCFQGWQNCSSCHSHDARVDALNWDNLNDGIGNPKNAKSLLLAHQTPPSMALAVRADAHVSVRAGIRNSLFTVQPESVAQALDAYLQSLQPIPSPRLDASGNLTPEAERGRALFTGQAGCADCHSGALATDLRLHDVGTRSRYDQPTDRFDTPSLVEVWRSAPYLHDGSAATLRDVLTTRNTNGKHGAASKLTPAQIDDLVAYVESL